LNILFLLVPLTGQVMGKGKGKKMKHRGTNEGSR